MSLLFAILALGIGLGGLGAGIVSRSKVEIGLVPIGAFGVGLSLCLSALFIEHYYLLALVYLIAGMCGGFCVVPLYSLFQQHTPAEKRGIYMGISQAASNSGLFIVLLVVLVLQVFAASYPAIIFVVMGIITIGVSAIALSHTPIALIRCLNWIFTNFVYRIRAFGTENVPEKGGALLVCNHISYFDPLLVSASVQRTVRFLILRSLFDHKLLGPILRTMKAIPISSKDAPKRLLTSLNEAREAIKRGDLVCVFAEGEPARVGHMIRFSRGLEIIMKGLNAPIIPAYLDQTWGSLFDYVDGKYKLRVPQEIPYPATLTYGKPLKPDATTFEVRQTVSELGTEAFKKRRKEYQFLHLGFIKEAKRRPFHTCMVESSGKRLNNLKALVGAIVLSKELKKRLVPGSNNVGIFLPPCIGSALSNIALLFCNLVPVNLNYTASKEASKSSIGQAKIKQVLTSKLFLSKVEGPEGVDFIYLDELINQVKKKDRILSLLFVVLTPFWFLKMRFKTGASSHDSLATIIFSSGSTGIPKGIMLSHANVSSNVESLFNAVSIKRADVMVSILPFFHAFGFTTGLWLPLVGGLKALYHFSPLEAEAIGELVKKEKGTILLGTPTFFMSYVRRIPRESFASIRLAIAGAEKLRTRIAKAFNEAFGFTPLEGYGCSELSPVAMINLPDIREATRDQIGNKPGTVGHPIPGVAVKVVDPDTRKELPLGTMGLLLVKGPNVMKGYLDLPEKTAEVVWDGWYATGDLATLDKDGFVTLHDRISRFSKVAGEMVPHGAVEDAVQRVLGEIDLVCAVSSVPDDRKGERIVVLHTKELDAKAVVKMLSEVGLPNLWIPRSEDFFLVQNIPILGSGKLDLQGIKKLAAELASPKQ